MVGLLDNIRHRDGDGNETTMMLGRGARGIVGEAAGALLVSYTSFPWDSKAPGGRPH